jgi:hypothetical protein
VVRGEITLQEEGKEKKTFKVGDRADVGANVKHEAWIGSEVLLPRASVLTWRVVHTLSVNNDDKGETEVMQERT